MHYYDQGAVYRVTFNETDRDAFARCWPCCNLPERGSFTFDSRNDDLIDLHPETLDGPEASALADDCRTYAQAKRTKRAAR